MGHAANAGGDGLVQDRELRKRNAIRVFITVNGNGRKVTRPPPQSELWKRNALCVNN